MPKNKPPARTNNTPKQSQASQRTIVAASKQWSGPLPAPEDLEHFNHIIPNGAERIVSMVEQEQAHRIECEKAALKAAVKDTRRGHLLGGGISLLAVVGCVYTAVIGAHPAVSVALVSLPIATIVITLVKGRGSSS